MSEKIVGIAIPAPDARSVIDSVVEAENAGIRAAWLTSGGDAGDALTAPGGGGCADGADKAGDFDYADLVAASDNGGAAGSDDRRGCAGTAAAWRGAGTLGCDAGDFRGGFRRARWVI